MFFSLSMVKKREAVVCRCTAEIYSLLQLQSKAAASSIIKKEIIFLKKFPPEIFLKRRLQHRYFLDKFANPLQRLFYRKHPDDFFQKKYSTIN